VTALLKEQMAFIDQPSQIVETEMLYQSPIFKIEVQNKYAETPYDVKIMNFGNIGNVEAAIRTTQAMLHFNPDFVILSGICGGFKIKSSINLGDIIIPEEIIYYEYGKIENKKINRRYQKIRIDSTIIEKIKEFIVNDLKKIDIDHAFPKIHFNPIASGEKVVADETFQSELKKDINRLIGIEMEGYGTGKAVIQSGKLSNFFVVKSIADWADNNKNDDWHDYASKISAEFILFMIKNINLIQIKEEASTLPKQILQ
jgi:nucleoside phosphorylase